MKWICIGDDWDCTELRCGDLHVWRIKIDVEPHFSRRLSNWLSMEEMNRAEEFKNHGGRDRFITGRGTLRALLSKYIDCGPKDLEFQYSAFNKPQLASLQNTPHQIQFNFSHSSSYALLAVTIGRELGVDIERIRTLPDAESIIKQFFSESEQAEFLQLPRYLHNIAFFRGWVRKEAFVKGTGRGLINTLNICEVPMSPSFLGGPMPLVTDEKSAGRWHLYDLEPGNGYVGALAVNGNIRRIRLIDSPAIPQ